MAGEDGLAVGRFGWANIDTARANNARSSPDDLLGFVIPVADGAQAIRITRGVRYIRPGVGVTLMSAGDYFARFPAGALAGSRVYASLIDGSAISGEAADAEATPWYVVTDTAPGGLAIISTTIKVTQ